jgi:DNA-nicking Smr family endonuclease
VTKKKKHDEDDDDARPAPAPKVGTSMKGLLSSVKLDGKKDAKKAEPKKAEPPRPAPTPKKAAPAPVAAAAATTPNVRRPSDGLRGHDRTAFYDAMAGVRPIGAQQAPRKTDLALPPAPKPPSEREGDRAARAKLAALVAGGLHFEVRRDDDWLAGLREDAPRGTLEALSGAQPSEAASLDLHGARAAEVDSKVGRFVRAQQRAGVRRVRIVHGKGLHSDAAGPVLAEAVLEALTKGTAASAVLAFVTAPPSGGGSGALLVELARA